MSDCFSCQDWGGWQEEEVTVDLLWTMEARKASDQDKYTDFGDVWLVSSSVDGADGFEYLSCASSEEAE